MHPEHLKRWYFSHQNLGSWPASPFAPNHQPRHQHHHPQIQNHTLEWKRNEGLYGASWQAKLHQEIQRYFGKRTNSFLVSFHDPPAVDFNIKWKAISPVDEAKQQIPEALLRRVGTLMMFEAWILPSVLCSPNLSTTAELSDVRWIPTKKVVHIGRISTLLKSRLVNLQCPETWPFSEDSPDHRLP